MNILPNEVESIKVIGRLFDNDVKMVKTMGGFYLAVGKKKRDGRTPEALAGGSHQAIVAHQLSKEYGSDFQPAIFKSEQERLEDVVEKSEYLPNHQISKGIKLYTLSKGDSIDFIIYRYGTTLGEYKTKIENNALVIKSYRFNKNLNGDKKTAEAISKAIRDTLRKLNLSEIKQ